MDLMNVKRHPDENIDDYLIQFRQMKAKCFTQIPEHELVQMVAAGLDYSIRKKLINQQLRDMAQLADRVRQIEQLQSEKDKIRKSNRRDKRVYVGMISEEMYTSEEENEVDVAELKPGPPYMCQSLKPVVLKDKIKNETKPFFGFDITKVEQIFDVLVKDKQIELSEDHKIPSPDKLRGRRYCKYHNRFGHSTNNCLRFRDLIQAALKEGRLKFDDRKQPMKVDTDPFEVQANYVEPIGIDVLMVELKEEAIEVEDIEITIDEFEQSEAEIYPKSGDTLVEFLTKKQDTDHEVMLCPRCSAVFDKAAAKAFEESEMKKQYEMLVAKKKAEWKAKKTLSTNGIDKGKAPLVKTYIPPINVPKNQWIRTEKSKSKWQTIMSGGSIHSGPNYQTNVKTVLGKEQAAKSSHSTPSVGIKQNEGQINIIGSQS